MGYLFDAVTFWHNRVDCPDHYQYAMVIEYEWLDRYNGYKADDLLALTIKAVLPDVEEWQVSVIKPGRVKFRFHTDGHRTVAKDAIETSVPTGLRVRRVTLQNPPDRAN